MSTELGVAEREGRYGFRRARRGPSVGHALFGRVNSAECPGAQPTPTHPLPSLRHTAIYHIPLRTTKSSEIVSRNGISLSLHPASFASVAQSARRRPPSALSSSAASSASSSRSALPGFSPRRITSSIPALMQHLLTLTTMTTTRHYDNDHGHSNFPWRHRQRLDDLGACLTPRSGRPLPSGPSPRCAR